MASDRYGDHRPRQGAGAFDGRDGVKLLLVVGAVTGVAAAVLGILIALRDSVETECDNESDSLCHTYPHALEGAAVSLIAVLLLVVVALAGIVALAHVKGRPRTEAGEQTAP